jgi:GrpB-like predicted nucleotidyltransferase (UPF0157 family)
MSNEELWQLFPIILEEHNPIWKENYIRLEQEIKNRLGIENISRINHIGSTYVTGLLSKPTIDILLEIVEDLDLNFLKQSMLDLGYIFCPQPKKTEPKMMFMQGYIEQGFHGQVVHLHVRYSGDWDELYFRDYLVSHPKVAHEYGELKKKLQEKFEYDRDGYTEAKGEFIRKVTELARKEFIT